MMRLIRGLLRFIDGAAYVGRIHVAIRWEDYDTVSKATISLYRGRFFRHVDWHGDIWPASITRFQGWHSAIIWRRGGPMPASVVFHEQEAA